MRILILNPPSPPFMNVSRDWAGGYGIASKSKRTTYGHDSSALVMVNVSLSYVAGILASQDDQIVFLDGQAENLGLEAIRKNMLDFSPEVLIAIINLPSIYGDLALLNEMKETFKDIQIICIGTVCKSLHKEIMSKESVDICVIDDPELVIPRIIRTLKKGENFQKVSGIAFREGNMVNDNPLEEEVIDLDALPYPPYHLMPMDKYRWDLDGRSLRYTPVLSSRGCPFKCGYYCPYPFGFGKNMGFRDPKKIVDEIDFLKNRFGVELIVFRDQVFTMSHKRVYEICSRLIEKNLEIKWICETRLESITENLLKTMKASGCVRIHYGLETADFEMFNRVAKPGKQLDDAVEIIKRTKECGIVPHTHLIVGLPGENWDTIHRTVNFLKRNRIPSVQASIITPYPGTRFFEEMKDRGLILTYDWSQYTGSNPVVRTEYLSAKELTQAKQYIYKNFWKEPFFERAL
jgi:anaerobic magnesium-protoporphyrin IX monomethyl ester cyclase